MYPWSIKKRLIRSLIALFTLFWIAGVVAAGLVVREEVAEVFDSALRATGGELVPVALEEYRRKISGQSDPRPSEARSSSFSASRSHVHYLLRERSGAVVLASTGTPEPLPSIPLKKGFYDRGDYRYYTHHLGDEDLWFVVAHELQERREAVIGLWLGLASPLIALLPIAAFAVWRTVDRTTKPMSRVSHELETRGGNDLNPIDTTGLPSELTPVIESVNTLMTRLKAAIESERAFAANAAHELRNPIAAVQAQIQVLAANLRGTADSARAEGLASQLAGLGRRVEKMLQMARAEAGLAHSRERTDLAAITALVVNDFHHLSNVGARLKLEIEDDESCWVVMDQDAIAIVLRNAIENAVHHGSATQPIDVRVTRNHTVRVINACDVLPRSALRELTRRFRRGNAQPVPGSGLGLTIVDMIMRQAGGALTLASPAHGRSDGFEAVLEFPGVI
ncbi:sensor histidine kinase [Hyphomicrobium sp.]|uniref:sensor histidine kinase n=1 Tax=Hyphomicrobium sp. TaxID=82 RepID=UPI002FDE594C